MRSERVMRDRREYERFVNADRWLYAIDWPARGLDRELVYARYGVCMCVWGYCVWLCDCKCVCVDKVCLAFPIDARQSFGGRRARDQRSAIVATSLVWIYSSSLVACHLS